MKILQVNNPTITNIIDRKDFQSIRWRKYGKKSECLGKQVESNRKIYADKVNIYINSQSNWLS